MLPEGLAYAIGAAAEIWSFATGWTGRKARISRQTVKYASMNRTYSCQKLKDRCGYRPIVGLEEGFQRSVKSFVINERKEKEASGDLKKKQ